MLIKLELGEDVQAAIARIKQRMELQDVIAVIQRALAIYDYCTKIVADGGMIVQVDVQGTSKEVVIK